MLDYVAHIFHKHILATWVEFEAGTLGWTLSSLTVVLTVTDMANGQIQWTVEREKKCHSKETCMVFVVFPHIHISYPISHPIIQSISCNLYLHTFMDLIVFTTTINDNFGIPDFYPVLPMGKTYPFTHFHPVLPNRFYPVGKRTMPTLVLVVLC